MTKKAAGWTIIGIAIILGVLRIADVISPGLTAVLFVLAIIILGGASIRKKKPESEEQP